MLSWNKTIFISSLALGLFLAGCLINVPTATPEEPEHWSKGAKYKEDCTVIVAVTVKKVSDMETICRTDGGTTDKGVPITEESIVFGCTKAAWGLTWLPPTDVVRGQKIDYTYLIGHEVRHALDKHCGAN